MRIPWGIADSMTRHMRMAEKVDTSQQEERTSSWSTLKTYDGMLYRREALRDDYG
jgi:hypothetical protein